MHRPLRVHDSGPNNSCVLYPTDSMSSEQRQKLAKERREERARYIGKRPDQRFRAADFFKRTRWIRLDPPLSLLVFTDNVVVVSCCFLLAWLSEQQTQLQGKRLLSNKKKNPPRPKPFYKGDQSHWCWWAASLPVIPSAPHEQSNNLFFVLCP